MNKEKTIIDVMDKNTPNSSLEALQSTKKVPRYIFPNFLAQVMSKVDLRTQYEASMMSMSLISVGLVISVAYFIIYSKLALWYKIFLGFNGLAGLIFMWSFIITTYQQYKAYMEIQEFQKQSMKGGNKDNGIKRKT